MTAEPTGIQHRLSRAGVTAHIAQVGAALRGLNVGGTDLVPPYPLGRPTPFGSGAVLVPWPNRIRDGHWARDGTEYQLAITEPARHNAIHGLLRYAPYSVVAADDDAVELGAAVFPQPGYPFSLDTTVEYRLTDAGIAVTHTLRNTGGDDAPVAVGVHPFVTLGGTDPGELVLTLPAGTHFPVDDRLLPAAAEPVAGTDFDLRSGRRLGDLSLDDAFGAVERDADGLARYTLTADDGRRTVVWAGAGFDFVQVFTTARYPGTTKAVAIEPMTAPADAFNSGIGVKVLSPDEIWRVSWGIELEA